MGEKVDGECLRVAAGQRGLITREQALEAGLSDATIDRRVKSGRWTRLGKGVFLTAPGEVDWAIRTAAAALASDGAAAGPSAAFLWEVDGFEEPRKSHLVSQRRATLKDASCLITTASWLEPKHLTRRQEVPVLQPPWVLLSLGEYAARDDLEVALDFFVRKRFATWDHLAALAAAPGMQHHPGARLLRDLLEVRAQRQHTDSILETRAAQVLRNSGLGEPVLQFPIRVGPDLTIHADLAYPEHNLLIETVGVGAHRSELRQYTRDCRRMNRLSLLERRFVVLHYTWDQITRTPKELIEDVAPRIGRPVQECFRMLERPGGRPALYATR